MQSYYSTIALIFFFTCIIWLLFNYINYFASRFAHCSESRTHSVASSSHSEHTYSCCWFSYLFLDANILLILLVSLVLMQPSLYQITSGKSSSMVGMFMFLWLFLQTMVVYSKINWQIVHLTMSCWLIIVPVVYLPLQSPSPMMERWILLSMSGTRPGAVYWNWSKPSFQMNFHSASGKNLTFFDCLWCLWLSLSCFGSIWLNSKIWKNAEKS